MKLECLQENLAEGLSVVGRVVPTKSTLPVLSNVLLSTRDGELQLTANNLELSVAHRVPAAASPAKARSRCPRGCCPTTSRCSTTARRSSSS